MRYLPELYYFFDTKPLPFAKAFLVTAEAAAQWCDSYQVTLLTPKRDVREREKTGRIPRDRVLAAKLMRELFDWVQENSEVQEYFRFLLFRDGDDQCDPLFGHHDDTCCWNLFMPPEFFDEIVLAWKANGLPDDLFYPETEHRCVPIPLGPIGRLLRRLGFSGGASKSYSPKQWEAAEQRRKLLGKE